MDFFKSVFSDDPPDPPRPGSESESPQKNQQQGDPDPNSPPNPNPSSPTVVGGGWSFGGLVKTLTTKSESVIETYRRDLREFGSGLKKEIEVAHGSLENVGQVIDELGSTVLKGTAEIISQGKDAILSVDLESDSDNNSSNYSTQQSLNSKPYSRFEAQLRAIQGEEGTYCEEPEDLDDYNRWKSGFDLEEKGEEIEGLLEENGALVSVYKRVVPNSVDNETFWCRYFYRVYKLKQAQDVRSNLVKRAISREEEEELSWDVDDDDAEEEEEEEEEERDVVLKAEIAKDGGESGVEVGKKSLPVEEMGNAIGEGNVGLKAGENRELGGKDREKIVEEESSVKELEGGMGEESYNMEEGRKGSVGESSGDKESDEKMGSKGDAEVNKDLVSKSDEKLGSEGKAADSGESCKGSDFSVVSTQPSMPEEDDLGWDEIEDLSSIDEKKASQEGGSPNRAEVRKRLSAADEEEEDLSWDTEDDDEPAKA
ncbi:protein DOS2 [Corylus avellana]|uniref:protein DOS2 n=1 Tax=Corylus avellana TaxID=13451 RepID=UPI001E1ECBA2|nr:protein DOS2 [Corylus avellana]